MSNKSKFFSIIPIYALVILLFLAVGIVGNKAITVISMEAQLPDRHCIIIDAGHGGVDGGATSCTGVLESQINLELSLRLNDLMHLLGYPTKMIRTTDISIHTEGESIAQKKISDLKNRVKQVNETQNGVIISIHQNTFPESQYHGAQVFYPNTATSEALAKTLQNNLITYLNPGSTRKCKKASGIYLMEKVTCPGVLIECGFLSNPSEEAQLRAGEYQKNICCVIAVSVAQFLNA